MGIIAGIIVGAISGCIAGAIMGSKGGLIKNIILGLISRDIALEIEFSEVLFGLVILCLSQYFSYGASLEKDVNGLL